MYVSENVDVAHAAPTPVTEYVAPAPPGACAAQIPHECLPERIEKQIVDTHVLSTMEEIVETVQILQERFQQSIEEQIVDPPVTQVMEEEFVAVAPTIAAIDMDAWVESMFSLNDVPLAERLRLKREAEASSAERAAAELLNEEMSTSPSPIVRRAKNGRFKK